MSALLVKDPSEYFDDAWYKYRTGQNDILHTKMTTLPFLLLELSPFVTSDSDYPLISRPLCKSKTLLNIFMILGRNVE